MLLLCYNEWVFNDIKISIIFFAWVANTVYTHTHTHTHIYIYIYIYCYMGFPGDWVVRNLPAMQETWVQSLGQEDPLEKGMKTHSSILAWRIPCTEEPDGLQSMGPQRVRRDLDTEQQQHTVYIYIHTYIYTYCIYTHNASHACIHEYICMSICIYTCLICIWYMCVSIYIYIYIYLLLLFSR